MSRVIGHGAPPSIGWWPASPNLRVVRDFPLKNLPLRYWDGKRWSRPAYQHWTAESAAEVAAQNSWILPAAMYWTDRPKSWPEHSRT